MTANSKVHIQKIQVKQAGQRIFFQVKLPADAHRIISVEAVAQRPDANQPN